MQYLFSWWDSYQTLSTLGTVLKFLAAILGILILVFGLRESSLRSKAQSEEGIAVKRRIEAAEASARPRVLSPEQKDAITNRLLAIPEKQQISVSASVIDAEAMRFAEDIEGVFLAAGFEVHLPKEMQDDASIMVGPPGLHISVKNPKRPFPLAAKIQRCFMDSGIMMLGLATGDQQLEANSIEIVVGQK